jgi:hypothetical protein
MQITGTCQVGTSSAARQRCLGSCMRAVVRSCCCTCCCTALTRKCQGNLVRFRSATPGPLSLASMSAGTYRCRWRLLLGYSAPGGFGPTTLDANYRRIRRPVDLGSHLAVSVVDASGLGGAWMSS